MTSALLLPLLAPLPGAAESHSSNSSSNCSNGRCSRLDSLFIEDGGWRRGYIREERWREEGRRHAWREREFRNRGWGEDRQRRRQRDRDDDDDDD